tara:strand:- start:340 stop:552 length:213 start_codon:yes stop_codon:yes gene_type:complete
MCPRDLEFCFACQVKKFDNRYRCKTCFQERYCEGCFLKQADIVMCDNLEEWQCEKCAHNNEELDSAECGS